MKGSLVQIHPFTHAQFVCINSAETMFEKGASDRNLHPGDLGGRGLGPELLWLYMAKQILQLFLHQYIQFQLAQLFVFVLFSKVLE